MMSMVGAAVAPDTAPASVLGDTWAPTDAGGYRSSLRRRRPRTIGMSRRGKLAHGAIGGAVTDVGLLLRVER